MLRPRVKFCAVVQDGKIFVMSGLKYETQPHILDAYFVEYYDPSIGRWQLLPPVKLDGMERSLHSLLNPTPRDFNYFWYSMTPLGTHELVFSSDNSASYVYNIHDNTVEEMKGMKKDDLLQFYPYASKDQEPPVVLGKTRYFMGWREGQLYGYRFDKFLWVKSSGAPVVSGREYPRAFRSGYHALLRVDGSSIASQGNNYYALWFHRFHQSHKEIMCKSIAVSHNIETPEENLQAPFELLDVRTTPSISQFIPLRDHLLDGLVLDGDLLQRRN